MVLFFLQYGVRFSLWRYHWECSQYSQSRYICRYLNRMVPPSFVSGFINPINYSYTYHKP